MDIRADDPVLGLQSDVGMPTAGPCQEVLPEGRMTPEDAFPETQLPPLLMVEVEAEKPSVLARPADQGRQDATRRSAEELMAEVKVADLQGAEQEVMRLAIQAPIGGRWQELEFGFNLDRDRPEQVSAEVVKALNLSGDELEQIRRAIANLADEARRRKVRGISGETDGVFGQRSNSDDRNPSGVDDPGSIGFGAVSATSESVVIEPEVVQPASMHDEAILPRSGCSDGGASPSAGSPTPGPGRSEVQDCPQEAADRLTEGIPRESGTAVRCKDDNENGSEEGGVLGRSLHDGEREEAARKGREKLLRVRSSSPPELSRKEGDQSPRQQTPRQGTAEVPPATARAARTEAAPLPENIAASPPPVVADRAWRSPAPTTTPSSPSRREGAAATPTPAAKRPRGSPLTPRSPVSPRPLVTKGFGSSYSEDSLLAGEPITSSEGLSRGVPSSPRMRRRAAASSMGTNGGDGEDTPAAAAALPCVERKGAAPEPSGVIRAAMVAPISKQLSLPPARRGRSQHAFNLGTPRERGMARKPSTPREQGAAGNTARTPARITAGLPPSEKGRGIPMSPILCTFGGRQSDSHFERAGEQATETEGKGGGGGGGGSSAVLPDNNGAVDTCLEQRTQDLSASARRDAFRRRGSQRLSRSSSWDDSSMGSLHDQQAMFSPGRFNPTSSALSWGSVDDSGFSDSARSLTSSRGPFDRTFSVPQLSEDEKEAVERLKIKRSDVNFGYHTLGSSKRVFKIELNGKMRAAKVINTLGMTEEGMAEVRETFDAELLGLSRLNNPHIVKVYGASVSPAEVVVVSEFVEGGVLRELLDNPRKLKNLTHRMRLGIAEDIALGMRSLYSHGMQHRHLTSNSILLTSDLRAKVLGVGLAVTTELMVYFQGEERADEQAEEELPWTSREVLAGAGFSQKSDVYSFGIILWEIMQREPCLPYAGLLPSEVVGAKYNGEGPSIPRDCPPTIARLMRSCWSNLPSDRPSFEKICDTLEAAEGWLESGEGLADLGASPLGREPPNRTMVSPLQEAQEARLEVDEGVGIPDSASGSGGPTPPGTTEAPEGGAIIERFFADNELPASPLAATPATSPPAATSAADQDQAVGLAIDLVPKEPRSETIPRMSSSGTGQSSNSLNDRTAVRIDAAIQAAVAIADTSSKYSIPVPTGSFNAVGGGGGEGGRNVASCRDLAIRPVDDPGESLARGSERSTQSALVAWESRKATSEARLDAAIEAALVIHATNRASSSSSSTLQRSIEGGDGASLALAAPRGGARGGAMLGAYQPPAPPRLRGRHSASRDSSNSSSGYYGDTSGGEWGTGRVPLSGNGPVTGRARGSRSGASIRAGVNQAVQALASARKAEAHQTNAAAARLQRLQDEQRSRRRRQSEQGGSGERRYRPGVSEAAAPAEQRSKKCSRRIADAEAAGQARVQAETRAGAKNLTRERVWQDEEARMEAHRAPPAAKVGRQAADCGSRAVSNSNRSATMQGTAGRSAFVPTVAGDSFLPETRRARVGAGRSRRQRWDHGDHRNANSSGARAHWNW